MPDLHANNDSAMGGYSSDYTRNKRHSQENMPDQN